MKLIVSGKTKEFTPKIEEKFGAKIAKLSKFIEQRGEREAHVTHQLERRIHKVELTVRFYDHALVGEGADADLDTALNQAVEKLEKQVVRLRERWRDTHRDAKTVRSNKESWDASSADAVSDKAAKIVKGKSNGRVSVLSAKPKVFRVDYSDSEKPMTLDEAILEMEAPLNYVVYRDANRDCLSVLVRRPDGNLDLIES
jgi:putative sigma-54 modulation protein